MDRPDPFAPLKPGRIALLGGAVFTIVAAAICIAALRDRSSFTVQYGGAYVLVWPSPDGGWEGEVWNVVKARDRHRLLRMTLGDELPAYTIFAERELDREWNGFGRWRESHEWDASRFAVVDLSGKAPNRADPPIVPPPEVWRCVVNTLESDVFDPAVQRADAPAFAQSSPGGDLGTTRWVERIDGPALAQNSPRDGLGTARWIEHFAGWDAARLRRKILHIMAVGASAAFCACVFMVAGSLTARKPVERCNTCGYDLTGLPRRAGSIEVTCTKCGSRTTPQNVR